MAQREHITMIEELGLGRGKRRGVYIYRLVLKFFSVRVGGAELTMKWQSNCNQSSLY